MRRKNAFLSCCLTLCLAVGMTVSVPVSAAAKTSSLALWASALPTTLA